MKRIAFRIPATVLSIGSLYFPSMLEGFMLLPTGTKSPKWSTISFLRPSQPRRNVHQVFHWNHWKKETFRSTCLYAKHPKSEELSSSPSGATVRFSGTEGLTSTTTNPVDALLTLLASDVASIALGLIGLTVVVAHRLSLLDDTSAESLTIQTRTDLLAVFACGSVLLDGITKLDVTSAMAESVVLEGTTLSIPEIHDENINVEDSATMVWALESLLTATPAMAAVVLEREDESSSTWKVLARSGTVPSEMAVPDSTPILDRVSGPGNTKETYLPTLQALPGKRELSYLPSNSQLALFLPIRSADEDSSVSSRRVLILGSNRAKSFTPRDVAWCRIVAERMASTREPWVHLVTLQKPPC